MQDTTQNLTSQLYPITSNKTLYRTYEERLNALGIQNLIDLIAQGHPIIASSRSKKSGVLNELGVTNYAFNRWLLKQPPAMQDEFRAACGTQELMQKNELVDAVGNALDDLELVGDDVRKMPTDTVTAPIKTKTAEARAKVARNLLDTLERSGDPDGATKAQKAGTVEVHCHVYASQDSKQKLLQLRQEKDKEAIDVDAEED